MAANRTRLEREAALDKLSRLYLTGRTQAEIGKVLAVSQQTISRDLKTLQTRWQASAVCNIDAAKAKELARIDLLERTHWRAWRKSCRDKEVDSAKKATTEGKERAETSKRREGQSGNPAFLAGVQWCIDRRCKLLNLDPARGVNVFCPEPIPVAHAGKVEIDVFAQIDQYAAEFAAAAARKAQDADEEAISAEDMALAGFAPPKHEEPPCAAPNAEPLKS